MAAPADSSPRRLVAVLDTNVYVGGVILSRGIPYQILEAWRRQAVILATSEPIVAEIARALSYPRIRDRYSVSDGDIARLVTSLRTDALVVRGVTESGYVSRDPEDDMLIACALEVQADCIVTGDQDLLVLGEYQGVEILRPREFLERLEP